MRAGANATLPVPIRERACYGSPEMRIAMVLGVLVAGSGCVGQGVSESSAQLGTLAEDAAGNATRSAIVNVVVQ